MRTPFKRVWPDAVNFLKWLVPVLIALISLWQSHRALLDSRAEVLLLQVTNYGLGEREVVGQNYRLNLRLITDGGSLPPLRREAIKEVLVDNYWKCVISNVGHRTMSIVALNLHRNDSQDREPFGFFEAPDKPVSLPIAMEAGASRRLLLLTAIKLDPKSIDILYRSDKLDNATSFDDLFNTLLFKAGRDHYGNTVRILPGTDGYARFEVEPSQPAQERFRLRVKTGGGNYFEDDFWWYKRPQF